MTITYSDDKSSVNIQELKLFFQRVADWKMPTGLQDWEDMITYTPLLVAAYSGDRLIGFARVLTDFVRWGEIYDVVVDDSFQGKGIGTELMKQLIDHEAVSRVRTFSLGASPGKSFFYERLGFRKVTDLGGEYFILVRKERDRELE